MWIHIGIFAAIAFTFAGWKTGWLPGEELSDKKGRKTFLLLAAAGNLLGLMLTVQHMQTRVPEGYRMEKKGGSYDKEFLVTIDEGDAEPVTVEVPEKEEEEAVHETKSKVSEEELQRKEFLAMLARYNEEQGDEDYFYLPSEYEGKTYAWEFPSDTSGSLLAALFLVAAAASLVLKGREKQAAEEKRNEALLMDYPELIMKFTLLVQSGMTVRNAFGKIAADYGDRNDRLVRPAYEEIRSACREMDSGVLEAEAYYRFGERCGQVKYKTFATLLVQNLQKGSRHLSSLLERESREAWDERKRKARILGEAAATKLLFPMILMMMCVMAIVMIPALLSFY